MSLGRKHKDEPEERPQPRPREPETRPAPKVQAEVCPVCGRRGRAQGHH